MEYEIIITEGLEGLEGPLNLELSGQNCFYLMKKPNQAVLKVLRSVVKYVFVKSTGCLKTHVCRLNDYCEGDMNPICLFFNVMNR